MKPFWKSKTVWASALSFAAYLLAWPQLTDLVPAQTVALATAAVMFLLRFVSDGKVTR